MCCVYINCIYDYGLLFKIITFFLDCKIMKISFDNNIVIDYIILIYIYSNNKAWKVKIR